MNVALTRAKSSLFILGNAGALMNNLRWSALIRNAKERKVFLEVDQNSFLPAPISPVVPKLPAKPPTPTSKEKEKDKIKSILKNAEASPPKPKKVNPDLNPPPDLMTPKTMSGLANLPQKKSLAQLASKLGSAPPKRHLSVSSNESHADLPPLAKRPKMVITTTTKQISVPNGTSKTNDVHPLPSPSSISNAQPTMVASPTAITRPLPSPPIITSAPSRPAVPALPSPNATNGTTAVPPVNGASSNYVLPPPSTLPSFMSGVQGVRRDTGSMFLANPKVSFFLFC